jgi:hypothetical protein
MPKVPAPPVGQVLKTADAEVVLQTYALLGIPLTIGKHPGLEPLETVLHGLGGDALRVQRRSTVSVAAESILPLGHTAR